MNYHPIDCSLHDQYLAWATRRTPVLIDHTDENGVVQHSASTITDVFTAADSSEWMTLGNGTKIRLDRIRQVSVR